MKKLSLIAACTMSVITFAGMEKTVLCSSTGPDFYADGTTPVQDGEVYALVWTPTNSTGFAMNSKGECTDGSRILGMATVAKDQRCSPVLFVLKGENANLEGGDLALYLFDTRVWNDPKAAPSVAQIDKTTGAFVAYNSYEQIAASIAVNSSVVAETNAKGGEGNENLHGTIPPNDVTPARISNITVKGGSVYVEVENTIPSIRYTISAGRTPTANEKQLAVGVNGVAGGKITLVVDDPNEYRFFRVVRSN